jgi:hypothetical protein
MNVSELIVYAWLSLFANYDETRTCEFPSTWDYVAEQCVTDSN